MTNGNNRWLYASCFMLVIFNGCMSHNNCTDKELKDVSSPDNRYLARLYERTCSETKYTGVVIEKKNSWLEWKAQGYVFFMLGQHSIELTWLSATHLEVHIPSTTKTAVPQTQDTTWEKINISYK